MTSDSPIRELNFTGQERIKSALYPLMDTAISRNTALNHLLLCAPRGQGKLTLAYSIAAYMGVNIRICSADEIEKQSDLAAILTNISPNDILFIPDIDRVSKDTFGLLSSAMLDFSLSIVIGKGAGANRITINLPPFAAIGATTSASLLSREASSCFLCSFEFDKYSESEIALILSKKANELYIDIVHDAALNIARRSDGSVYSASVIMKYVHDYGTAHNIGVITSETVDVACKDIVSRSVSPNLPLHASNISMEHIDLLTGVNFEELVASLFEYLGYHSVITRKSGDQGADIILARNGFTTVIQAKRQSGNVGNSAVQEVIAGRAFYKAHKALVITNRYFTKSARDLASSADVILWDRDTLGNVLSLVYINSERGLSDMPEDPCT